MNIWFLTLNQNIIPKFCRTILINSFIFSCIPKLRIPQVLKSFISIHSSFILGFHYDLIVQDLLILFLSPPFQFSSSIIPKVYHAIAWFCLSWLRHQNWSLNTSKYSRGCWKPAFLGTSFSAGKGVGFVMKSPEILSDLNWMPPTEVRRFGPGMEAVPWQGVIRWQEDILYFRSFWVKNFTAGQSSWIFPLSLFFLELKCTHQRGGLTIWDDENPDIPCVYEPFWSPISWCCLI